jgi:hypothetical protein
MGQSASFGQGESQPKGHSSPSVRVAETDLAILTAFCRPYIDGDGQFAVPAPNTEILRELAENGFYLDIDALRGHLRNLYAKFGVEDGLNPAQKRARLAALVYENRVIGGWEPRESTPEMPVGAPATASPEPPTTRPSRSLLRGPLVARRAARLRGFQRDRWRGAAGVAALLLGVIVVLANLGGSDRTHAPVGSPNPAVIDPAKDAALAPHNFKCEPAEFCLGRRYNLSGGLYQNTVSDPELRDNIFFQRPRQQCAAWPRSKPVLVGVEPNQARCRRLRRTQVLRRPCLHPERTRNQPACGLAPTHLLVQVCQSQRVQPLPSAGPNAAVGTHYWLR